MRVPPLRWFISGIDFRLERCSVLTRAALHSRARGIDYARSGELLHRTKALARRARGKPTVGLPSRNEKLRRMVRSTPLFNPSCSGSEQLSMGATLWTGWRDRSHRPAYDDGC